jgi:hypothetical protein
VDAALESAQGTSMPLPIHGAMELADDGDVDAMQTSAAPGEKRFQHSAMSAGLSSLWRTCEGRDYLYVHG